MAGRRETLAESERESKEGARRRWKYRSEASACSLRTGIGVRGCTGTGRIWDESGVFRGTQSKVTKRQEEVQATVGRGFETEGQKDRRTHTIKRDRREAQ
jgi:hypothetical protein